jgi:hypothetical protein
MFSAELGRSSWTNEQKLWASVLVASIKDYQKLYDVSTFNTGIDAYNWLTSEEESIGSFIWVCGALRIKNHEEIRDKILSTKKVHTPHRGLKL